MNNADLFIQLILEPMEKVSSRIDFHKLELTEKDDIWYLGSGATRRDGDFFGYVGMPSSRDRELANVLDISVSYELHKHFAINGYYSHLFVDDVVQKNYRGDDGDYFYLEANFRF